MAIVNIVPIPGSRSASQDESGKVSYQVAYSILTDSISDGPNYVSFNQPYSVGVIYDGFPITNIAIDETEDPCQWTMLLTYGSIDGEEGDEDPLGSSNQWVYSVNYEQFQIATDFTIDNKPIVNTAGQPFQEALMADSARPSLTARKNFSTFPWAIANQYCNTINRDSWLGAAPKTLKFERLSGQQQTTKVNGVEVTYFDVTVEITFNRDGWTKQILNAGLMEKKNGKLQPIKINGKDITSPVLLNASGAKAEDGSPPHVLKFDLYRSQNFAPLFA